MKTIMVGTREYNQVTTPRPNGKWFTLADMYSRLGLGRALYWWIHQRIDWLYHQLRYDYWQYNNAGSIWYDRTSKTWIARLRGYAGKSPWYPERKDGQQPTSPR